MRIVSLAPSNTEILYALGCGEHIIANTRFCDYPAEAKEKPKVGGWLDVDIKKVKSLQPDIVLTSTFVQNGLVKQLQQEQIHVFHTDPKTLAEVYQSIFYIGMIVGKEEEARKLVDEMKETMNQIAREQKSMNIRIYCEEWHNPPTVSANWVPEVIENAGGVSLAPAGKESYPVTLQEIQSFDPQLIILSLCGIGEKATEDVIRQREGWKALSCPIKIVNDSLLNRPGPRLVDGSRIIAQWLKEVKLSQVW